MYDIRLLKQIGHTIGQRLWIHRWIKLPFIPFVGLMIAIDKGETEIRFLDPIEWFEHEKTFHCELRRDESKDATFEEYKKEWSLGRGGGRP